jgi:hypothetical protein
MTERDLLDAIDSSWIDLRPADALLIKGEVLGKAPTGISGLSLSQGYKNRRQWVLNALLEAAFDGACATDFTATKFRQCAYRVPYVATLGAQMHKTPELMS